MFHIFSFFCNAHIFSNRMYIICLFSMSMIEYKHQRVHHSQTTLRYYMFCCWGRGKENKMHIAIFIGYYIFGMWISIRIHLQCPLSPSWVPGTGPHCDQLGHRGGSLILHSGQLIGSEHGWLFLWHTSSSSSIWLIELCWALILNATGQNVLIAFKCFYVLSIDN